MSEGPRLALLADMPEEWQAEVDLDALERLALVVLRREGQAGELEVELLVVDEAEIRRLNAEYRGRDETTDVLSFPLLSPTDKTNDPFVTPPDGVARLGDIVICLPRAREQAQDYGHSATRELGFLFVHGLLHLLGYDHEEDDERQAMRAREEAALAELGLRREGDA